MPVAAVNGIRLSYQDTGTGQPVLMLMGSGSGGRVWHLHQVPDLVASGRRVVTVDNRGIPPTEGPVDGLTVHDLVADVAALIEHLALGPCPVVGTSMGAYVALELALARPELVRAAVLMAARGRPDRVRELLTRGERELYDAGTAMPPSYRAGVQALQMLSPRTLDDDGVAADWLDLFELTAPDGPGWRAHLDVEPPTGRLTAYAGVRAPCLVIAFADDLITPPRLGRELAGILPHARYEVVADAGHYGYLEQPEVVNKLLVDFLRDA